MKTQGSLLGGALLVAGTCIGAGVLALPVLTGMGGFFPSVVLYLLCWVFMTCTGLLYLEASHWMPGETNIVSMAEKTLGMPGKVAAWGVYLFFFYCLTVAYIVGCGNLMTALFPVPEWAASLLFVGLFAPFIFAGSRAVGKLNAYFMAGLAISYFSFLVLGWQFVNVELLTHVNWPLSFLALPITFAAFGYQGIVPTLSDYMGKDLRKTRNAILLGSTLSLIFYLIWQLLILGIVPVYGSGGLAEALQKGQNAVQPLKTAIENKYLYALGQSFAFFALTTSFFGVTLGLSDFLADGLKVKKTGTGKLLLLALVFLPPLAIAITNPHIFLQALDLAGGLGSALLLGLLPIFMVWSGRYRMRLPHHIALPGGRWLLAALTLFVLFELVIEIKHLVT